jgi:hypothetical protein
MLLVRKQSDEANPSVFTYSFELFGNQFAGGKIEPRKVSLRRFS